MIHLVGLPHTQVNERYLTCAYTQKLRKFCKMFANEVILYAPEGSDAPCVEHVATVTEGEQREWFGEWDQATSPDVDWDDHQPWWQISNRRTIDAIRERHQKGDIVLITTGRPQAKIVLAMKGLGICVEWAVGYEGVIGHHRIFESYAWMHHVYGLTGERDGRWYDAVVPNFFDTAELPMGSGGDYLFWMARWIDRKGYDVALEIQKESGLPLILAGPGFDGRALPDGVIHVGPLGVQERAHLLGGAKAFLAPTKYIEPFGGASIEAMMCGTPSITTDWGAYTETIPEKWRFRTLSEGVSAIEALRPEDRKLAREWAVGRYSLTAVKPKFEKVFDRMQTLWSSGWYEMSKEVA